MIRWGEEDAEPQYQDWPQENAKKTIAVGGGEERRRGHNVMKGGPDAVIGLFISCFILDTFCHKEKNKTKLTKTKQLKYELKLQKLKKTKNRFVG